MQDGILALLAFASWALEGRWASQLCASADLSFLGMCGTSKPGTRLDLGGVVERVVEMSIMVEMA